MKKISRAFVIIIISMVILGLTLPLVNIFAEENAQSPQNFQVPQKDIENKLGELIELKDNDTLSEKEKEEKEIQIRKEVLIKITDLSLLEIKNLEDKINSLELESEDQIAVKSKFLEILENNKKYSEGLKIKIEKDGLTLNEIKNLAQEYKDWRENNYNKYVKKITVFMLVFQEKGVLKTANIRLEKIIIDLKKLESVKILKKEDTWSFINSSIKNLANAQIFNNNAETIILKAIKKDIPETASSTPIMETATSAPEIIESIAPPAESPTATTSKIILEEDTAQNFIEKSLQEIKNAYDNFIGISNKVRLKLKIK